MILEHYEWQSRLANTSRAKGFGEGFAEGMATALAIMLETRGITVSEEVGERVMSCTDTEQLDKWLRRAAVQTDRPACRRMRMVDLSFSLVSGSLVVLSWFLRLCPSKE